MKITILTFFPEVFQTYFESAAPFKKAIGTGLLEIDIKQIRDYTVDRHNRCDGAPYGGGAGLVLFCQPILDALSSIEKPGRILFMTPGGEQFNHDYAVNLSKEEHITIVAGRYEGYDKRIFDSVKHDKVSVGDYVLTGGETAGLIVIDAAARLIEGVLDNPESLLEESFTDGLLEYDHYARPNEYNGIKVPDILLSGHHARINEERHKWALINTYENRPDLLKRHNCSRKEIDILKDYIKEKYSGKYSTRAKRN